MKRMNTLRVSALLAAATLLSAGTANAGAFYLSNQSARAMGRASAVVADPRDASTIWYNPAGLGLLPDRLHIYAGASLINVNYNYRDFGRTVKAEDDVDPLVSPHAYIAGRVAPWLVLGFGFNPSYGATVRWGADSPGRTVVREQSLRTFWLQPTAAIDFRPLGIPGLSLAGTVDIVRFSAYLSRDLAFGDQYGSVNLSGTDWRVGGHFGLAYRPEFHKALTFGAMYRLPVRSSLNGTADFDAPASFRGLLPPDGNNANVDGVDIPQQLIVGASYTFFDHVNVEVDGIWNDWSDFTRLKFTFPDDSQSVSPKLYKDRWGVRTGVEYRNDVFAVRAGYEYDPTPIRQSVLEFTLPDINRHNITAGASLYLPANFWIDAGYWMLIPRDRDTNTQPSQVQPIVGTFHTQAWQVGLSVGWKLPQKDAAEHKEVAAEPLRDSDNDGIPDASDACPTVAGNDGKGCPIPVDTDADGITDDADKCPTVAGVAPDGCPPDSDKDGVVDANDACPNEAGDMPNGCPNPDRDGDLIANDVDKCPNEPETRNGFQDADGCPDELPPEVAKFNGKLEGVKFQTGSSRLTRDSYPALDAVAVTLKQYPELRLEVSGHTDNIGKADKNLKLSQARADSVKKYLTGKGVAPERINSVGMGDQVPVAENTTKEGQAANRRIEFKILQ